MIILNKRKREKRVNYLVLSIVVIENECENSFKPNSRLIIKVQIVITLGDLYNYIYL